jgi:hypothetical protein
MDINIRNNIRNIAVSWVLYSIRETIGLTIVRNTILKKQIQGLGKYPDNIQYGKTFGQGDTFEDIYEMVSNFEGSDKRYLIFTSNGQIVQKRNKRTRYDDSVLVESHYVSFIVDKQEMVVTMIDPSRKNGKIGIYNPYIGLQLQPYFKKNGYKVEWLEMTTPCQINHHDVFCQSWTLFLVFKFMKQGNKDNISISKKQSKKYKKLLEYFKNLAKFEIFKTELKISYLENIKNHDDFLTLKNCDPYELLLSMTPNDMNDEGEDDYRDESESVIDLT